MGSLERGEVPLGVRADGPGVKFRARSYALEVIADSWDLLPPRRARSIVRPLKKHQQCSSPVTE
jgi:hypothetical protein